MTRVLILEDEHMLRLTMAKGLGKLPGVTVTDCATVDDAVRVIDGSPPDVVVSDIDLPGRSGLELLGEFGRRGLHVPVVFVTGYLRAYRSQIPQHADVDVLEKPVSLKRLREVVQSRIGGGGEPKGGPFGVTDYLQLACMGNHSVVLRVTKQGKPLGRIEVWKGQVVAAADEDGAGEAAFCRLAFADDARVACASIVSCPEQINIDKGWEVLLLDAVRRMDEEKRFEASGRKPFPHSSDDDAVPESEPELSTFMTAEDVQFERAWESGVDALLSRSYEQALRSFTEAAALRPHDGRVRANLRRLGELGVELPPESEHREVAE